MGNKHTKEDFSSKLSELGELLWKLGSPEYIGKEDEIIKNLEYKITDDEVNFILECKYFNPIHYIILSSLWLNHLTFVKLCSLIPKIIPLCTSDIIHKDTKVFIFKNNNHVSNLNLDYVKMERVKTSLMRTGTMDNLSESKFNIYKSSVTQRNIENDEKPISSYTAYGYEKLIKKPPPIKRKNPEPPKLERPLTYYMLSEEEKKSYETNQDKINKYNDNIKNRVSTKTIWFQYAIYNSKLWEEEPSKVGFINEIDIGEMSYLSFISYIQIKISGKYSTSKESSKNLVFLYKLIMDFNMRNSNKKRRKSIVEKISSIFH